MGDETEDDYMSDVFLQQVTNVRPGLLSKTQKRKIKDEGKPKDPPLSKRKKFSIAESQARQLGLSTPIAPENKGFALLEKMGYKKGSGIGKLGEGKTTLIPLVLKDDRTGLGRDDFVKEKEAEELCVKKAQDEKSLSDFVQRNQHAQACLRAETDFLRSQKACEQLDIQTGLEAPITSWFWPRVQTTASEEQDESDSEEENEEIEIGEKMTALTEYLQTEHFYCVWCGTSYKSKEDMSKDCPGNTKELHD